MKRPKLDDNGRSDVRAFTKDTAVSKCPILASALAADFYDGTKEPRERSGLSLRFENGVWVALLQDKSSKLMLRCSAESYEMIPLALEALLGSPKCPWEVMPWMTGKKRK
jgi:hypothetical protein